MKAFDHIGLVTHEPHEGESWVAISQVWVTNPRLHPQRIEYIRPKTIPQIDPADVGLWKLWHLPHVAYRVEDLEAALEGEDVVFGPIQPGDFAKAAFVHKDGIIVEYIAYSSLDTWFGQPTPWKPAGPLVIR